MRNVLASAVVLACCAGPAAAQNAWDLDVWTIESGSTVPLATAVSPAGTAAAGRATTVTVNGTSFHRIFVWTESSGFAFHNKAFLSGVVVEVVAVSDDGQVVAGFDDGVSPRRAWRWTAASGFQYLADAPNGTGDTIVRAMSADGATIFGRAFDDNPNFGTISDPPCDYSTSIAPPKVMRDVAWTGVSSPSFLNPFYETQRRRFYCTQQGYEIIDWAEQFQMSMIGSPVDSAGSLIVGGGNEHAGSSCPDFPLQSERMQAMFVSMPSSAIGHGALSDCASAEYNTVSSTGGVFAGWSQVSSLSGADRTLIRRMPGAADFDVLGAIGPAILGGAIRAFSVSPDGEAILVDGPSTGARFLWLAGTGFVDLNEWIQTGLCIDADPSLSLIGLRIVDDGPVILGRGFSSEGSVLWRLRPAQGADADDDGLLDDWEIYGLDINSDGLIDLDLPAMGADPDRKDLFVEVDRMRNVPYFSAALDLVKQAFANAPNVNPDFTTGITLHIDTSTIDVVNRVSVADWNDFRDIKDGTGGNDKGSFGTDAERASSNWAAIRCAREAVFRYALFVDKISDGQGGVSDASGMAEGLWCDDFMIAGGTLEAQLIAAGQALSSRLLGWVFMHELGHALDLDEGGDEDITFKPNYVSVMNYAWPHMKLISGAGLALDYSREEIHPLNEANLVEVTGVNSTKSRNVISFHSYYDSSAFGQATTGVWLNGSVQDFDQDGLINTLSSVVVMVDLNRPNDAMPVSAGQVLTGYNDWAHIKLPLGTSGNFRNAVYPALPSTPDVPATTTAALLVSPLALPQCITDSNRDGVTDGADLAGLLAQWGGPGAADLNGDGVTDGADLAALLAAWGACQ